MKYLITGRGGTGKTTIHELLLAHGYTSFDGDDIPGLAGWVDLASGMPCTVDYTGFVDYTKVAWNWDEEVLRAWIAQPGDAFLCGSASNQLAFHSYFDFVFVLSLPPDAHRAHLSSRSSTYGKDPATAEWLIKDQARFTADALAAGAIPIDASCNPQQTFDQILDTLSKARDANH